MIGSLRASFGAILGAFAATSQVHAGALQISPTTLTAAAPAGATALTVANTGKEPVKAQVRVFRWTQVNGEDVLTPATSVVASPPFLTLNGREPYTLRVVRTDRQAPTTEESYRVLLDELPNRAANTPSRVNIVVRLSVPAFFKPQNTAPAKLSFRFDKDSLVVTNSGGARARLADLMLRDDQGRSVSLGRGLNGYVLAGSSRRWILPPSARLLSKNSVTAVASTEEGPLDARVATRN
jgi:fimbrial chaperone protein